MIYTMKGNGDLSTEVASNDSTSFHLQVPLAGLIHHYQQVESIISSKGMNSVRTLPKSIELSMFTFIFISGVPPQNQITQFKVILFGSLVINLFNIFLDHLSSIVNFFFGLHQVDHLIYSSLDIIWFFLSFLQYFHDQNSQ